MQIDLTEAEIERYTRHIMLPEIGGIGQMRLKTARVLVVGAGGLGCPLLQYLAAAGVGTLGVVDGDVVDLSNLQRQILHGTADIGRPKVTSASARLHDINPEVRVVPHNHYLDAANADALVGDYDLVCDASDNFTARFTLADACVRQRKTLVSAAVLRNTAQLATFKPHAGENLPCYRCLYPAPPPEAPQSCADAGILGAITGVAGTLQATLALQELLGIGTGLAGKLLIWDALSFRFRGLVVPRDPACGQHGARHASHAD